MKLTSDDLKPIWDHAYAMNLGSAPYQVVMAAARLAGDRATHVLAEANVDDDGTRWRLLWLTDSALGVVDATSAVGNWCSDNAERAKDPQVRATIRPLSDCRRITYEQDRSDAKNFGMSAEFRAQIEIGLHFDDGQIDLSREDWTYGDTDKLDELQAAVVERWERLHAGAASRLTESPTGIGG